MKKRLKINGELIVIKTREPYAPKEKVKQSKRVYNRKKNKIDVDGL
jgi:hypothetical protein